MDGMKRSRSGVAVLCACLVALGIASFALAPLHDYFSQGAFAAEKGTLLPVGTLLPITLEHALSSKDLTKGEPIEGRVMQDIPLANREKIPAGAKIRGVIVSAFAAKDENGASSITFRLDTLELRRSTIKIVTGLRVMAPYEDVQAAQVSSSGASPGSPDSWLTTVQIGGDIRYGSGGKVTNRRHRTVGKATSDGVLVRIEDPADSPCAGWPNDAAPIQATWVFSADACGLFDLKGVRLTHAGNTEPLGEITLSKAEGDIKIMKSSALLLRIVR